MATSRILALALLLGGCETFTGSDVKYVDCVEIPAPYVEQFNDGMSGLRDRCWHEENVTGDRQLQTSGGDLIIGYASGPPEDVTWQDDPPALVRRFQGDFVLVTHVEATEVSSAFCLAENGDGVVDSAGIVVHGTETDPAARAALRLWPDQDAAQQDMGCPENIEIPVHLEAASGSTATEIPMLGTTGEADIAVCRKGTKLRYFYRQPEHEEVPWDPLDWKLLQAQTGGPRVDEVGDGPLDAGIAAMAVSGDPDEQFQGAFNWVGIAADGDIGEDCPAALEQLQQPNND